MPIEVKELIIRTSVREEPQRPQENSGSSAQKDLIIQEAVDKVMEIIDKKKKR
jgi:hypothetical protein